MADPKPPVTTVARAVWRDGLVFEGGAQGRTHLIDGNAKAGASPVESFLAAFAACSGSDVVDFLAKRRTPARSMSVDVNATRRGDYPRRVMKLDVVFTLDGESLEVDQVERAIQLSFERYCTVAASLAGDIELRSVLVLNGARGEPVVHPMFSATFPG